MTEKIDAPSKWPTTKVGAGVSGGLMLGNVIAWILGQYDIQMPNEVAVSLGSLLTFAVAYLVRDRARP